MMPGCINKAQYNTSLEIILLNTKLYRTRIWNTLVEVPNLSSVDLRSFESVMFNHYPCKPFMIPKTLEPLRLSVSSRSLFLSLTCCF